MKRHEWLVLLCVLVGIVLSMFVVKKALAKHPLEPDPQPYSTNY